MRTFYLAVAVILALLVLVPAGANAQHRVRIPPFTGTNYLNDIINGDTLANGQRRDSSAVYVLTRGGSYLSQATITNSGWTLTIVANDTTPGVTKPVVYLYTNPTTLVPPTFVTIRGNVVVRNIIVSGYFEPLPAKLTELQGQLFNFTAAGYSLTLDSCMLTNSNGNHVRSDAAPRVIRITNCVFANMGYLGRSNLGAGKAIDVRAGSVDSLIVVNNTFVNWQDRIIRHFSSTANIQYLRFEHNTCVNGMSYHGFLSLGRVGRRVIISNNMLVDHFAAGQDTDGTRQLEFIDSGEKDAFGFARMTWVISAPNDSTIWNVSNNYYRITPTGQAFFDSASVWPIVANPPLTAGSPLTYHINSKVADSTTAFLTHTTDLPKVPNLMTAMMKWYRTPAPPTDSGAGKTKNTGTWKAKYDFDRRIIKYYTDTLDCAYVTSSPLYTAATGAYPVGDLNWFPTRYAAWLNDPTVGVAGGPATPAVFGLMQNYPNPFNPATKIEYSLNKASRVTLEVFDLLGRSVATLVRDEQKGAGDYSVTFAANKLASGMYIYRLSASGQIITKKMMLLK